MTVKHAERHDSELVAAALAGDQASFGRLVERHATRVFRVCFRVTRDEGLAEDAVQETFIKAHRKLATYAGDARFTTWLHRIAVNAALEQVRQRVRRRETTSDSGQEAFLDTAPDPAPEPEREVEGYLMQRCLQSALDGLSDLERAAFSLRHFEHMSIADICMALGIETGACKQAIFRAVQKMRTALAEFGGQHA